MLAFFGEARNIGPKKKALLWSPLGPSVTCLWGKRGVQAMVQAKGERRI